MGSLKFAVRAAGWWPPARSCSLKELSSSLVNRRPLIIAGDRIRDVNPSTTVPPSNYHVKRPGTSAAVWGRCAGQRRHPVLAVMQSPSRDSAAHQGTLRRTDVTASSFSSSASSTSSSTHDPEDVLDFWFKDVDPENNIYESKNWFLGGPHFDKEIETKFGECVKLAADGALDGWKDTVRGRLALVILLDQFSRNIYRKSPLAYANDEKARKITLETISQVTSKKAHIIQQTVRYEFAIQGRLEHFKVLPTGQDKQLAPMERNFLYLPLMHSENLEDHDVALTVFKGLAAEYSDNEHLHKQLLSTLSFEEKHRAVVEQFGRYPSRNEDLGRQSTPEEVEFLAEGSAW